MVYLEVPYAQKDEAKPLGARWDPKVKLWYFPGDLLPEELERYRPKTGPKDPLETVVLNIPFAYREIAAKAGAKWNPDSKAYLFEKRAGDALPAELEGFEPKQFSWEEKIQRELNGSAFPDVPAQRKIVLKAHQIAAVDEIFSAYNSGYPGFLLADDVGLGKTFSAWAAILKILESAQQKLKILIVCPLGVVPGWRSSIQWMGTSRWVEELLILNYEGLGKLFEGKPRRGAKKVGKKDLARRGTGLKDSISSSLMNRTRSRIWRQLKLGSRLNFTRAPELSFGFQLPPVRIRWNWDTWLPFLPKKPGTGL